jgi:leucyl-tRNA synthetase
MFPYPSGAMHMGHVRNYLIGDVLARYYRMRGFDVLHPMGWDALGLPAENAAIKDGLHPADRTRANIVSFKAEMKRIGLSYDWSRELATCDPDYYRWNQWLFLKFREHGLVYRRHSAVNWCTSCQTVIANEQVKDGQCERCGNVVVLRRMPEWAFRITRYSERLLANLDGLPEWQPEVVKKQRNWIGKSEGVELQFRVPAADGAGDVALRVFTTRADTVFGCTYLVVAPDHELLPRITLPARRQAVAQFAAEQARKAAGRGRDEEIVKEGVDTGARALHPFTGAELPVWAANFVVADYGTGAVMSVPAHDERDFEFAQVYGLPIRRVIESAGVLGSPAGGSVPGASGGAGAEPPGGPGGLSRAFTEDGLLVDSDRYTGLTSAAARVALAAAARAGGFGGPAVVYRQRDWGFSRQRYWGTPIPIVYCDRCDPEGDGLDVPLEQLPVQLPSIDVAQVLTGRGEAPLAKVASFVHTSCPRCHGPARRETETMDTFVDSSWYYVRFVDPNNTQLPFARDKAAAWLPVDVYIGGPEHSTMHLLYFRFWTFVMQELGLLDVAQGEPVRRMVTQGIVNGPDGRKMSKRWGNVITPSVIIERHGADAARTFVMFAGPADKDIDWSDAQVEGCSRFLQRVWRLARAHRAIAATGGAAAALAPGSSAAALRALEIRRAAHKTLKRVTDDLDKLSFNTAIARVMELTNVLTAITQSGIPLAGDEPAAMAEAVRILAAVLAPFAPHLADEIGEAYGLTGSLQSHPWPSFDPALVVEDELTYAVQVNGKLRGEVRVATTATQPEVESVARADDRVAGYLRDKTVAKVVFVPGRLVNFVVRP